MNLASPKRGAPDRRGRDTWSIPGSELADLAERIHAAEPDLDRAALKRAVAKALGWERYTAPLDKLLEAVIQSG